jgi:hypothetical protein
MKDLFSSFDRFAASFTTGVLLLYGVYLIISWRVPWAFTTVEELLCAYTKIILYFSPKFWSTCST